MAVATRAASKGRPTPMSHAVGRRNGLRLHHWTTTSAVSIAAAKPTMAPGTSVPMKQPKSNDPHLRPSTADETSASGGTNSRAAANSTPPPSSTDSHDRSGSCVELFRFLSVEPRSSSMASVSHDWPQAISGILPIGVAAGTPAGVAIRQSQPHAIVSRTHPARSLALALRPGSSVRTTLSSSDLSFRPS